MGISGYIAQKTADVQVSKVAFSARQVFFRHTLEQTLYVSYCFFLQYLACKHRQFLIRKDKNNQNPRSQASCGRCNKIRDIQENAITSAC
jgi:hypothetical protein